MYTFSEFDVSMFCETLNEEPVTNILETLRLSMTALFEYNVNTLPTELTFKFAGLKFEIDVVPDTVKEPVITAPDVSVPGIVISVLEPAPSVENASFAIES